MSTLINASTAHALADTANEANFKEYLRELHGTIKSQARLGRYSRTVSLPTQYRGKSIEVLTYFNLFGYTVTLSNGTVSIAW